MTEDQKQPEPEKEPVADEAADGEARPDETKGDEGEAEKEAE